MRKADSRVTQGPTPDMNGQPGRSYFQEGAQDIRVSQVGRDDIPSEYEALVEFHQLPWEWLTETVATAIWETHRHPGTIGQFKSHSELASKLIDAAKVTLGFRLITLTPDIRPKGISPRDFEYLSLFGPILARYGIYDDVARFVRVVPTPGPILTKDLEELGALKGDTFTVPEWYGELMRFLRINQLKTNYSLPREKTTDDPSIFKTSVENGRVVGVEASISAEDFLLSTLTSATMLVELFGQHRVAYGYISAARTAIESVALAAVHRLRA